MQIAILSRTKQMLRTLSASRQMVARRTGMSFVAIALVLQSFVLVMGAQAQASSDDMISGGVGSKEQILAHYDANTNNFRDVMTYNGITRAELASMSTMKRFTVDSSSYSWGWTPRFSEAQGQRAHSVAGSTVYSRPHSLWNFSWYNGWEGKSATRGTFRIVSACGNLVTYSVPTPPAPKPTPKPEPKPQPAVTCDSLTVTPIQGSRTKVRISGKASGQNGGVVKELRYYVFDANGNTIIQASAPGAESSTTIELPDAAGTYKAQVYAISDLGNITSTSCTAQITVPEKPVTPTPTPDKPSITIAKTVNKQKHAAVAVGQEFTYEITVTNTGKVALKDVVVTDNAPTEVSLVKADAGAVKDNTWTYTISEFKAGEAKSFVLTAKYSKYAAGTHKNNVCVDTPTISGGPDACDNATTQTDETIEVCVKAEKTIRTIKRSEYDASKHVDKNSDECKTKPVNPPSTPQTPPSTPSQPTPPAPQTPSTPAQPSTPAPSAPTVTVMPQTGPLNVASGLFGVSGIAGMAYAYVASRRSLR